jgi:hypothetical protein
MDSVKPRDWRKAKPGTHTREITKETIPQEVQELLLEMVDKIRALETKVFALEHDVGHMGRVTLNDLMRKTA